jgi:hypothetical protein
LIFRRAERVLLCVLLLIGQPLCASGTVRTQVDPDTGLQSWHWRSGQAALLFEQRLPDQTRAFFAARGFPPEAADRIGRGCVFKTIVKNGAQADQGIEYHMDQWRVVRQKDSNAPVLKEVWAREWQERGLPEAARIAFQWALLPSHQHLEPGDYNWGMTSFGLPPGTDFDLEVRLRRDGAAETGMIRGMRCPEDIERDPTQRG